jgi:hypothetical protein
MLLPDDSLFKERIRRCDKAKKVLTATDIERRKVSQSHYFEAVREFAYAAREAREACKEVSPVSSSIRQLANAWFICESVGAFDALRPRAEVVAAEPDGDDSSIVTLALYCSALSDHNLKRDLIGSISHQVVSVMQDISN